MAPRYRLVRTVAIAIGAAAAALLVAAWSVPAPGTGSAAAVRPLLTTGFDGPAPWHFGVVQGSARASTTNPIAGRASLSATAGAGQIACVKAALPPAAHLWLGLDARVAAAPARGSTVLIALTSATGGVFVKLQHDGRLALVRRGGRVLGRSAVALRAGTVYGLSLTWPRSVVRVTDPSGIEIARLGVPGNTVAGGAATTLRLGVCDRLPARRSVTFDRVQLWPNRPASA